jgi:hypothetical protein
MVYFVLFLNIFLNLYILYFINKLIKINIKLSQDFNTPEFDEYIETNPISNIKVDYERPFEYVEQLINDDEDMGVEVITNEQEKADERRRRGY